MGDSPQKNLPKFIYRSTIKTRDMKPSPRQDVLANKPTRLSRILSGLPEEQLEKEYVKRRQHPKTDVEISEQIIDRLTTRDKVQYPGNAETEAQLHVPHKQLLRIIDRKIKIDEPLTGFDYYQQNKIEKAPELKPIVKLAGVLKRKGKDRKESAKRINVKKHLPPDIPEHMDLLERLKKQKDDSFVYIGYAVPKSSEFFNPYCFREITYQETDGMNLITASRHGITQFGRYEALFTPLDKWEENYLRFKKVLMIPTFSKFRLWKGFAVWRTGLSWRKYKGAQAALQKTLYILDVHLGKAILTLRQRLFHLTTDSFVDTTYLENIPFFYFLNDQIAKHEYINSQLISLRAEIMKLVNDAMHASLLSRGFYTDDRNFAPASDMALRKNRRKPKSSDTREIMSFTQRANKRKYCGRLARFLEYVDYVMISLMYHLLYFTFRTMVSHIEEHLLLGPAIDALKGTSPDAILEKKRPSKSPQTPMFVLYININTEGVHLDPNKELVMSCLSELIDMCEQTVYKFKPFVSDPFYLPFTEPTILGKKQERVYDEAPDISSILQHENNYQNVRSRFFTLLEQGFDNIYIYLERFNKMHAEYKEYLEVDHELLKLSRDLKEHREMLERVTNTLDFVQRIVPAQPLGLFLLKQNRMLETVLPIPQSILAVETSVLPFIGTERSGEIMQGCMDLSYELDKIPEETEQFVQYLTCLDGAAEKCEELEGMMAYTTELYDIMRKYNVPVTEEDELSFAQSRRELEFVKGLITLKNDSRDQLTQMFNTSIGRDIKTLVGELDQIRILAVQPWLIERETDPQHVRDFLAKLQDDLEKLQQQAEDIKSYQKAFKVEIFRFDDLDDVATDIKLRILLWDSLETWDEMIEQLYTCDFEDLDVEELNGETIKMLKNVTQIEKGVPPNKLVPILKESVESFKEKLPVIGYLRNPNLKTRHWLSIESILGRKFPPEELITLRMLDDAGCFEKPDELMEISGQASSEAGLEMLLKKVENAWKETELAVVPHKDSKDVFILAGLDELQLIIDESNININTIAASRHVGPIKPRVDEWMRALDLFSKTLDEWYACQQSWLYLEAIFSAPDIQRQLPKEAKLFILVDKSWKEIMRRTQKTPLAMPAMTTPGVYEQFKKNNQLLDVITRCLEAYLEVKRVAFPRFYFLSNDELLEILAQTKNPHAVQPHLRKCFDAIARLEFATKAVEEGEDPAVCAQILTTDIVAMLSPEDERVPLGKGLKARGSVEDWLGKVEEFMFNSLKRRMKASLIDYDARERMEWLTLHPNQIVLIMSQLMWARNVHRILESPGDRVRLMQLFEQTNVEQLTKMAAMARTDITKLLRKILCALITIDVHARDTITNMVHNKVRSVMDFEWLKMIRYYWVVSTETVQARMANACLPYGYEYLGASGVLVITPLTDRCYLCLMGALQMDLGGAPAGPAGTGKTETTKDLAKALAVQCVVFNCSEGLDYKMMGRFFSGLAQSGAWCCFDEFNRIDIEVLSVIAQQLVTIRNAKASGATRFMFEGREIKLVRSCAAFITMNPGYAGRTELPDNLKALFRPMAMMVPDYALIAEVILYSEGFEDSKPLAQKMVQMYKLCSEQLSIQDHYDFGMRAVKSVLVMAGALKRASPDQREDVTLICALRDTNLPKFLADDAELFSGILSDLFPGLELPVQEHGSLYKAIVEVLIENGLQPEECIILKIIQLHETMVVRWGVMLVGPTGGGKTTVLHTLGNALTRLFEWEEPDPYYRPVNKFTMNPKAIHISELYGEVNSMTLEWKDGLMGIAVRQACASTEELHQWIINDGPVDAVWIENLNTVLDDNKMLCLANSERIKLTQWVHMLFEVMDLSQASPATVSRCGMVYIDPENLGWLPYVKSWFQKLPVGALLPENTKYLMSMFTKTLPTIMKFAKKKCNYSIHQVEISKITMLCSLVETLLREAGPGQGIGVLVGDKAKARTYICQIFMWSTLWSVGGNLIQESRERLEELIREEFEKLPDASLPEGDLWSIFMDPKKRKLISWDTIVPDFDYDPEVKFFEMLVPTVDTARFGHVAALLLEARRPVMFTGDTGVGKSVIAREVLNKLNEESNAVPAILNFSAQTSSFRTQEMLELRLEKRRRTQIGAPIGKYVIIFVDDVNMPKLEIYGAQPPIELLRQVLDFGGLYDREKMFWKDIVDVVISCACAPPGGGRNPLTPRFVRHFSMLLIPPPQEISLKVIFQSILKGFFKEFTPMIKELEEPLVSAAVVIYERIAEELLPTPAKSHYVFNLRDLSKCVQGILQADYNIIREAASMSRLFYHECLRVFHDRLINDADKSYFHNLMREVCTKFLGTPVLKPGEILLFGDFMYPAKAKEERIYEEITNLDKLRNILTDYMDDYNVVYCKDTHIDFFIDAIEHTLRLTRLLRAERGNGLMVGVSGMGRQTLTRLAAHVNGYKCVQIELTRGYDHSSFHDDLRILYWKAGALNEPTVFLFTDTQIVKEEFLEDINNILNSGEVPNLFEADEYEKVIIACREPTVKTGVDATRDAIYDFFIQRVRANLHLVICMSPVGDAFRRRCRMFPSLVNCCTIDWYIAWPEEALLSVADRQLKYLEDPELIKKLSDICVLIHKSVEVNSERFYDETRRRYYTTPSSYLELLTLYGTLLGRRSDKLKHKRDRIATGLQKINETNEIVATMEESLRILEPQLAEKSVLLAELMKQLAIEQAKGEKVRVVVRKDEAAAQEKAAATQMIADDAQADLDTALPALLAAEEALKSLNKNDINELRVFVKPPKLVQVVMEAVCILLQVKPDWATAKLILGDTHFLERLQEYDKNHIPEKALMKLKPYIENKDFMPDIVLKVSKVAKSICMWVRAIDQYAKVYKIVEPKMIKLKSAETELNQVMAVLREKQNQLAEVENYIKGLEDKLNESLREQEALQANIELCAARLARAARLTAALGDEEVRWAQSVEILGKDIWALPGNILIAAACVAYLGAFSSAYREQMVSKWTEKTRALDIPSSPEFDLIAVLGDPYDIRLWNMHGLPRDLMSTENAIMMTSASRWPLIIDPQEQANRWIRNMEKENNLKVVKLTDPNLLRIMEAAIRTGAPVLIEEIGEFLDPTLGPILNRQIFVQSGRVLIRLGDNDVDYDRKFKLYMTTKLSNPHYLPEVCIVVTLINFNVTPMGLEDQLLADVVRLERPDLEQQRSELIIKINADKQQLQNLEDRVLTLLFTSGGCLLDDEALVETLNESKETSAIIAARLIETEATEIKISSAREKYRPLAARGSILYFVVAQLADVDPMYQFSLKYFNQIFNTVIESTPKVTDLEERLQSLMDAEILAMYINVSRGLFERHKVMFSFLLTVAVQRQLGFVSAEWWDFLLRGSVGTTAIPRKKPDVPALTDAIWLNAHHMELSFPIFKNVVQDVLNDNLIEIGDFSHVISIPGGTGKPSRTNWTEILSNFEKLMLIRALQEEKLVFAITSYVRVTLGAVFTESPTVTLQSLYADMNSSTPLVFVLSAGSDPMAQLQRFAVDLNMKDSLQSISLGQGQGPVAEALLDKGRVEGLWIFLQNCHLATSWMPSLEKIVRDLALGVGPPVNPAFRVFLSSMPTTTFPVSVLQNSVKVTNEPPKGVRANVKRALMDITQDYFENNPLEQKWRSMVFGIILFHGIILERRKFGPLGWNITYEFNDSDRECALATLPMFCSQAEEGKVPWDALEYITGEITYGGRVTDSWDQRCLKVILKKFFSPPTIVPNYKYSESGIYYCPQFTKLEEFREFANQLPYVEPPEVFGMHENANIAYQIKETQAMLSTLLEGQPVKAGAGAMATDEFVYSRAQDVMDRILKKVGQGEPYETLFMRDEKGRVPSLTTVLMQECDRFNNMLSLIHSSLDNLQKAIKGFVVMSEVLEGLYAAFVNNQIPKLWMAKAYPSLKCLSSFIHDLELRLDMIENWVSFGQPNSFWVSGFYFPQGFMTGALQTHARKHSLPIDKLTFDFRVMPNIVDQEQIYVAHKNGIRDNPQLYGDIEEPEDGVLIHGLFLDAARWDMKTMMLAVQNPGEMNPVMPAMQLVPTTTVVIGKRYEAPLYKTSNRAGVLSTTGHSTNFVVKVLLPTNKTQGYWVMQGSALLTQLTD